MLINFTNWKNDQFVILNKWLHWVCFPDYPCKMPNSCSVTYCNNANNLHRFPKDEACRIHWTKFCDRQSHWTPGPAARICSRHFTADSYLPPLMRFLKKNALPTITGTRYHWYWSHKYIYKFETLFWWRS